MTEYWMAADLPVGTIVATASGRPRVWIKRRDAAERRNYWIEATAFAVPYPDVFIDNLGGLVVLREGEGL